MDINKFLNERCTLYNARFLESILQNENDEEVHDWFKKKVFVLLSISLLYYIMMLIFCTLAVRISQVLNSHWLFCIILIALLLTVVPSYPLALQTTTISVTLLVLANMFIMLSLLWATLTGMYLYTCICMYVFDSIWFYKLNTVSSEYGIILIVLPAGKIYTSHATTFSH